MRTRRYRPGEEGLVSTDVSAGKQTTDELWEHRRMPAWERRRLEQEAQTGAAMGVLKEIAAHLGGLLDLTKAITPGDVLLQASDVIPANGSWTRTLQGHLFQTVVVTNLSAANAMTVVSQPPGNQAPAVGTGVFAVPHGAWRSVAMRGNVLTVYGTVGDSFDVVLYARPRPAAGGRLVT